MSEKWQKAALDWMVFFVSQYYWYYYSQSVAVFFSAQRSSVNSKHSTYQQMNIEHLGRNTMEITQNSKIQLNVPPITSSEFSIFGLENLLQYKYMHILAAWDRGRKYFEAHWLTHQHQHHPWPNKRSKHCGYRNENECCVCYLRNCVSTDIDRRKQCKFFCIFSANTSWVFQ